ncbi:hypothetical protein [Akkermansia sp.]|uniref:hypothetical protein n=1 Tax=Akkermansia sp. TaxID=1872421 RepID=UPI0025C23322|nr:hypothetical protein [Akkermansia sp.]MCC8149310.1 hypothetical protein [Akkermansia sp.]
MYYFRSSSANHLSVLNDPYLELVMARREEEARWGWIPFAAFVSFLFVYRIFGYFMPTNDVDGSAPWLFILVLAGWGLLALIHMIVLPIWMLIASLRYWEVNRKGLAVAGLLFSVLAPVCMVLMLSCWSVFG